MTARLNCLKGLEKLKFSFSSAAAERKRQYLEVLAHARLATAGQVARFHEILCFIQAWPDNAGILETVTSLLADFHQRADLRRHADELVDTGIAGTSLNFRFYQATALWLVDRWPQQVQVDWEEVENADALEQYLPLLASYSETPALDAGELEFREWIDRLKGPTETDAAFLVRRMQTLSANSFLNELLYDGVDVPLTLLPGPDTPSRTRARREPADIVYQTEDLRRTRPSVAEECHRPPGSLEHLDADTGARLLDIAHGAMVTRHRDLDAFAYADVNDVSILPDENGLEFVLYGVLPERRFLLETLYGFLVLKNGVPVSYGAITSLCASAEVANTVLDTFRGADSAHIFARTLAMVAHVFGADTFLITPYQLGEENEDAIASGAWWFYQKLGFRPRNRKLLRLMNRELARIQQRPKHRTSPTVLRQLASDNLYLSLGAARDDVLGELNLANIGYRIVDLLAGRFGSDREHGLDVLSCEAAGRLPVSGFQNLSDGERLAWRRWSPIVALLPKLERWPDRDRESLVDLIRGKGGRHELDYVRRINESGRLRTALLRLARE